MADDKLGRELAELARQLLLWLGHNELPGIQGLRATKIEHYNLFAGTYHQLERSNKRVLDNRILPNLWVGEPEEMKRFQTLQLGISHVLLVNNPNDFINLRDGRRFLRNRIVETPKVSLDRPGALMTVEPSLDSRKADDKTLGTERNYDFAAILRRADLVWDDQAEGARTGFQYQFVFSYETPRVAFDRNVKDVLLPAELQPKPNINNYDQVVAERARVFHETLYYTATYKNRRRVAEDGGGYYGKWRADEPRNAEQRQFRPTLLSNDYLKDCFTEHVMKKGDDILLIDLPEVRALYRLVWQKPSPPAAVPSGFTVQPLLAVSTMSQDTGKAGQADKDSGDADSLPGPKVHFPVNAVIFRAIDGNDELPTVLHRGKLDYSGGPPRRFMVDYKAYVRWYFNNQRLNLGSDQEWFESFVQTFFADGSYPIQLQAAVELGIDREVLFINPLLTAADDAVGPLKKRLQDLVAWCRADPNRYVFTQGMRFGSDDNPREVIGITPDYQVYEWYPNSAMVTRMELRFWLPELPREIIFDEVYRGSAGMLPFIAVVTWGGVAIMTLGIAAPGLLTYVARETIRRLEEQLATQVAEDAIIRRAIRQAAPQLLAMLVTAVMNHLPQPSGDPLKDSAYQLVHGFFEGFGGNALQHYLTTFDDRLKRAAQLVPEIAANIATKGGYRAYLVYRKISAAVRKIIALSRALRLVLTDDRAKKLASMLNDFGQDIGAAFLIILFVAAYMNFLITSEHNEFDAWVERQRKALQHMIKQTGNEIATYLDDLHQDIQNLTASGVDTIPPDMLRKHDKKLRQVIADKAAEGANDVAAIADFLFLLLKEMGIENWQELKDAGVMGLLGKGFDALPGAALLPEIAHKLGSAFGELVGTIVLEVRMTPKVVQKAPTFWGRHPHNAFKTALQGGFWRAAWRFVLFPFRDITMLAESAQRSLRASSMSAGTAGTKVGSVFSPAVNRDSAYLQLLKDLTADEEEISRRIIRLAADEGLKQRINKLLVNVAADQLPPHLGDLLKTENPEWPGDAIFFFLYTWLRIGMHRLIEAFNLVHDDKPFDGKFKIADLLDAMGVDVNLNDKILDSVKAAFTHNKP